MDYVEEYSKIMALVREYGNKEFDRDVFSSMEVWLRLEKAVSDIVTSAVYGKKREIFP